MRKKFYRGMALLLTMLLLVPLHGFSVVSFASDDMLIFEGHKYQIFNTALKWEEAKEFCEQQGGYLACITSSAEQEAITAYVKENGQFRYYYIGGFKSNNNWNWVSEEPFKYTNWSTREPNGSGAYIQLYNNEEFSDRFYGAWDDTKDFANNDVGFICEWNNNTEQQTVPDGYDFNQDKYSFFNPNTKVEKDIYQTAYGSVKGTFLYLIHEGDDHGLCYGMTATTAALNKYKSAVSSFSTSTGSASCLANISTDYVPGLFNSYSALFSMDILTYIKYGYIYQFDAETKSFEKKTKNDIKGLCESVKSYVNGAGDPLIINVHNKENEGHSLFVIGLEEDENEFRIIINDSNTAFTKQYLHIGKDYSWWNYSAAGLNYDSNNSSTIEYSFPADMLYDVGIIYGEENRSRSLNEKLYWSNENLLIATNDTIETSNELIDISEPIGAVDSDGASTQKVYWMEDNANTIDLTTAAETSELTLSDVNSAITLQAPANSKVSMTVDDDAQNALTLTSRAGESISVDFMYARDDAINTITITGTVASETVTAEETDTGLVVTGLNDMTVTLETADGSAETAAQVTDGAAVQITVDEENTTVSTDWTCSHPDANHDGICDNCGEDFTASCSHFCHSENKFVQFIWKILNFFYRLFGIEDMRICSCGKYHW